MTLTYRVEKSLSAFESWGGGQRTIRTIEDYDSEHGTVFFGQLCDMADELFCEGDGIFHTEVEINDWLWFDVPEMPEFAKIFR